MNLKKPTQNNRIINNGENTQRKPNLKGGAFDIDKKSEYEQKVLDIARVTRVTKGGKRFSFRTTIAIGDGRGKIGLGMAKGKDVAQSVQKAFNKAKKNLTVVPMVGGTIPHQVEAKYNSAEVILKPSKSSVKAGGPVRVVAKLAGITGLTGKLLSRTNNKINIAKATLEALKKLRIKHQTPNNSPRSSEGGMGNPQINSNDQNSNS